MKMLTSALRFVTLVLLLMVAWGLVSGLPVPFNVRAVLYLMTLLGVLHVDTLVKKLLWKLCMREECLKELRRFIKNGGSLDDL